MLKFRIKWRKKSVPEKLPVLLLLKVYQSFENSRTVKAIWIRFVVVVKATKFFRLYVGIECYEFYSLSTVHWHFAWNTVTVVFVIFTISPTSIQCFASQWNIFIWFIENKSFREVHCANYICSNWIINALKFITRQTHIFYTTDPICDPWFSLFVQRDCDTQFKKSLTHWLLPRESLFRFLEESRW